MGCAYNTGSPTLTAVSIGCAFVSHHVVDYIGETGYKSIKQAAIVEGFLLAFYGIAALLSDIPAWLLILAWISANLPDIIDNFRTLVLKKEKWFACHGGVGLFQITIKGKVYRLGAPVKYPLTFSQTVVSNVLAIIVYAMYVLIG